MKIYKHDYEFFGLYTFNRDINFGYIYVDEYNSKKGQRVGSKYLKDTCDTIHDLIKRKQ